MLRSPLQETRSQAILVLSSLCVFLNPGISETANWCLRCRGRAPSSTRWEELRRMRTSHHGSAHGRRHVMRHPRPDRVAPSRGRHMKLGADVSRRSKETRPEATGTNVWLGPTWSADRRQPSLPNGSRSFSLVSKCHRSRLGRRPPPGSSSSTLHSMNQPPISSGMQAFISPLTRSHRRRLQNRAFRDSDTPPDQPRILPRGCSRTDVFLIAPKLLAAACAGPRV